MIGYLHNRRHETGQVVHLPNRHTLSPEDIIRSNQVEIKVRSSKQHRIRLGRKLKLLRTHGRLELLALVRGKHSGVGLLERCEGLINALVEVVEGLVGLFQGRGLDKACAADGLDRCAGDDEDLEGESLHVVAERGVEEVIDWDVVGLGVLFGLLEDDLEGLETLDEGVDGVGVDCGRHCVVIRVVTCKACVIA